MAPACFRTSLLLPADSNNGLRLHIVAEEDLSGHTGCVPGGLAELSGGFLPWHGCQDQGKEGAAFAAHNVQPCAKSFRLLDLCWSHLLNGYRDNHTLIKRLLEPEQAPSVDEFCKLHVTVECWGKSMELVIKLWEIIQSTPRQAMCAPSSFGETPRE